MKHIYTFDDFINENNKRIGPKGWNWRKRFVDDDGNVYTKGSVTGKQDKRPDFEDHYKELQRLYQELDKYHKKDPYYKTIISLIEDIEQGIGKVMRDIKQL